MEERNNTHFTPGPWKVGVSANSRHDMMNYYVFAEREPDPKHPFAPELFICRTDSTVVERDADEKQGNAALIATAPEMYEWEEETLEVLRQICRMTGVPYSLWQRLEDLIAEGEKNGRKARGEE